MVKGAWEILPRIKSLNIVASRIYQKVNTHESFQQVGVNSDDEHHRRNRFDSIKLLNSEVECAVEASKIAFVISVNLVCGLICVLEQSFYATLCNALNVRLVQGHPLIRKTLST